MPVINNDGVLIPRKSIPDIKSAIRITKALRTGQVPLPANMPLLGGSGGFDPYYFKTVAATTTSVKVTNIRYRHGITLATLTDQTKTIPTTEGTYYVYLQALYLSSYTVTVEVSAVDTHPDQADSGSSRAWREEIAVITVAGSVITGITPIWPGHVMAIEGRVV